MAYYKNGALTIPVFNDFPNSIIGNLTNGSNIITGVSNFSYLTSSLTASNANLPSNTSIVSFNTLANTITLNGNATATVSSINSSTPYSPLIIPGPITIEKKGEPTTLLVYEILDNVGSSSSPQTPSQGSSVVVPTSAVGDVDVKMEQSADNVTWTECLPGTYNSSTVKRFFRLRAVEK